MPVCLSDAKETPVNAASPLWDITHSKHSEEANSLANPQFLPTLPTLAVTPPLT